MGANTDKFVAAWRAAIEGLNSDNYKGFEDAVADEATYRTSLGLASKSRDELVAVLTQLRQAGWKAHNILEIITVEEFVAMTYRNDNRSGPSSYGTAGFRVNEEGKATEMYAFTPA